jgi:hypothetical protein
LIAVWDIDLACFREYLLSGVVSKGTRRNKSTPGLGYEHRDPRSTVKGSRCRRLKVCELNAFYSKAEEE